jgi:hypothetical protein
MSKTGSEWRAAVLYAWLIASVPASAAIAAPFVVPADVAVRVVPACDAKRRGGACSACGMTQAFYAIARGDLNEARAENTGAVPVFAGLGVNGLAAGAVGAGLARRRRR